MIYSFRHPKREPTKKLIVAEKRLTAKLDLLRTSTAGIEPVKYRGFYNDLDICGYSVKRVVK